MIAVVGAKGGVGASTVAHNVAWAVARDLVARYRGRRSRSRLRHRRPRLQPGSAARHRRRGVLAGSRRYRLRRPAAVEMHRPSEPAGGAGDARSRLRFRRRGVRFHPRFAARDDALHRARHAASVERLDQAAAGERRRHSGRRRARPRQSAQRQEPARPAEGVAAERSPPALLPQPGGHARSGRRSAPAISPRRWKTSRSPSSRSSRRSSAPPPTTAR